MQPPPPLRIIHIWKFNTIIAFSQSCHTRHSKNNWQKTASTEMNLQQCKIRYNSKRWRLIWIYVVKFHPYIADFTQRTINIDIICTISIIIETNTNLMTKFGHKHRTLNTSEWISSTTIGLPRKESFLDCDVYGEGGILKLRMLFDWNSIRDFPKEISRRSS